MPGEDGKKGGGKEGRNFITSTREKEVRLPGKGGVNEDAGGSERKYLKKETS